MKNTSVIILAAGQGKRMNSRLPKVLHPILFQPMLHHVLNVAYQVEHVRVCVVVGDMQEQIRTACKQYENLAYFTQHAPRGTADALSAAREFFADAKSTVLVLSGDVPLLRSQTLTDLLHKHSSSGAACTLVSAELKDPTGYGRIIRSGGVVKAIREQVDCSSQERQIHEVNSGVYCFDAGQLTDALSKIKNHNQQGEYYLTDAIEYFSTVRLKIEAFRLADPTEMTGVNDRIALSHAEEILRQRINTAWMKAGVTIHAPHTVTIDARTELEPDAEIESGVTLISSRIGRGTYIESGARITSCTIGRDCVIKQGSVLSDSVVGSHTAIGPYAHLRPGNTLADNVKIGNFVELKKTTIGAYSKASHLSYLGDAVVGNHVNIGCGFITCNYDGGSQKHTTTIEDGAFIGSDSQAVAPITIGKNAYVASGTTLTDSVPEGALAIARTKQINKKR